MPPAKTERIRDPIHNIIEFNLEKKDNISDEKLAWEIINTKCFQRLRRIKQLGFSELVYPGATHTRFSHSIGTYHTARRLMGILSNIRDEKNFTFENYAIIAALLHDIGHGPFSHAFEGVQICDSAGKKSDFITKHEKLSARIIEEGELKEIIDRKLGEGASRNIAKIIKKEAPKRVENSVVDSQFDADRLDYMRRDRYMTGAQHSAIDFEWLMANLEVGKITVGVDDTRVDEVETFVLSPKAIHAAEGYILGLFQLYPTIYYHKATRGAEKMFSALLGDIFQLVASGQKKETGLPKGHPLINFAADPSCLETYLRLDDFLIWGGLNYLSESPNPRIATMSRRLINRNLYKCIDLRSSIAAKLPRDSDKSGNHPPQDNGAETGEKTPLEKCCIKVFDKLQNMVDPTTEDHLLFVDKETRPPYKTLEGSGSSLNQIYVRNHNDALMDIRDCSEPVRALRDFKFYRAYFRREDTTTENLIQEVIEEVIRNDA